MNYIKKGELYNGGEYDKFKQHFFTAIDRIASMPMVMNKVASGIITSEDVDLVKFLYTVGCCTEEQLYHYAALNNIQDVKSRLDRMIFNLIINKFVCTDENRTVSYPADACVFYCMHSGGQILLEQMADEIRVVDWNSGKCVMGARKLIKTCAIAEISLRVLCTTGVRTEVTPYPSAVLFDKRTKEVRHMSSLASYRYVFPDGTDDILLLDALFTYNHRYDVKQAIDTYVSFLTTGHWKKFYGKMEEAPKLLILVEDVENAEKIGEEFATVLKDKEVNIYFLPIKDLVNISDEPPYFPLLAYDSNEQRAVRKDCYFFS